MRLKPHEHPRNYRYDGIARNGLRPAERQTRILRGVQVETNLLPKVQVDIVVSKVPVQSVIDTAKKVLYTGHIGDGKIFVYDVENVIKVRTGEEGYDALQDVE